MTRFALAAALLFMAQDAAPPPAKLLVSVWYRGTPAGTPVPADLAVIRALGFRRRRLAGTANAATGDH
jgi:hypothetical protein